MIAARAGEHTGAAEWKFVIVVPISAIFSRAGVKIPPTSQGHFDPYTNTLNGRE